MGCTGCNRYIHLKPIFQRYARRMHSQTAHWTLSRCVETTRTKRKYVLLRHTLKTHRRAIFARFCRIYGKTFRVLAENVTCAGRRCFPHCCPARGGHKNTGFCGSSVFVTTDIPCDAVICRYESDTIDESRVIALGDVYDRSIIDSAGDYPAQRIVTEDGVIRFIVNPDVNKKGWSYPYDTRIEKNRKHRLSVRQNCTYKQSHLPRYTSCGIPLGAKRHV